MSYGLTRDRFAVVISAVALAFSTCSTSWSQSAATASNKPTTPAQIAMYDGADRQSFLESCAKAEGQVSVIAGEFGDTVITPLSKVFSKLYPDVRVAALRLADSAMVTRVAQEARARKLTADVLDNGIESFNTLQKAGLLESYYTPFKDQYPKGNVEPDGYYVSVRESVLAPIYNTNLLPSDLVPKTWDGLLNPALKGKMVLADSDVLDQLVTGTIEMRGQAAAEKYFDALSKQDVKVYKISARALVDLIGGGEAPMTITSEPIHAEAAKMKQTPVDWARVDTPIAWTKAIARVKGAPHPCAAALWTDFMLNPQQGQLGLSKVGYLPAAPRTPSQYTEITSSRLHYTDGIWMSDHAEELQDLKDKYFLRK